MIRSFVSISMVAAALAASATSQNPVAPQLDARAAAERFKQVNGEAWQLRFDSVRGTPEHIFGGRLTTTARAGNDASFVQAARAALVDLRDGLGFNPNDLELVGVRKLNLSRAGTSDKISVQFRQAVAGVPVYQGTVNVLFDTAGRLLSIDNQALPLADTLDVSASVSLDAASSAAVERFAEDTKLLAEVVEMKDYLVWGPRVDASKSGYPTTPAYVIRVSAPTGPAGSPPADRSYVIAARGEPLLLDEWSNVHSFDLTGNIKGWAQPGLKPHGVEPETLQNLKDVRVSASGESDVFTDENGNFNFPGVNTSKTVTATLNGQFSDIDNQSGSDASISQVVTPSSAGAFVFNAGQSEFGTAEVNAHMAVNRVRDWLREVSPGETTLDFNIESNVNIGLSCNAFYNGVSLNYYIEGESSSSPGTFCNNTAYSTVAYHEEGHWLNDLYGSTNQQFGMGEGGADVWATYIADSAVVGEDFTQAGGFVRDGENTNPFCGDDSLGCYGSSPHANGQPLMGAIWKVRRNLKNSLGDVAGGAVADQLMVGWYQAFDDMFVRTIIEEHWLVLDDDNGNLSDGTPHYAEIDAAFVEQGFPSFQLPIFEIDHAPVTHVRHEGDVLIQTDVSELASVALSGVVLHHSTDNGENFTSVAMTDLGGDSFRANVPGVASPARVAYYLEAQSASLGSVTFPERGADGPAFYDVGELVVVEFNDFEGVTDEGWTSVEFATQDDWQRGTPVGNSFDPVGAFSGSNAWGNDIGLSGFNGEYQPNVLNALFSPSFDLSGVTGTRLRYQRWLSVERGGDDEGNVFDSARVKVDGVTIWESSEEVNTTDSSWKPQDFDISALADNDSDVEISWELESDGGLNFGGWNLDDFALVSLTEALDTTFSSYGVATPGAGGAAALTGSGQAVPGGPVSLNVTNAAPGAFGVLFVGTDMISVQALGGTFLVGNFFASPNVPTNGAGEVNLAFQLPTLIDPILDGQLVTTQYWYLDGGAPAGRAATQGLSFMLDV